MMEPISVCDDDAGKPSHQVPRFQMMAANSSANTMAKPACDPTWRISSTGSSEMMKNATAPVETMMPRKFHKPDHSTATLGASGVSGVVEAVHEFEAERDEKGDAE